MLSGKVYHSEENASSIPRKLTGVVKCKCWCHEEGLKEKVCVKCLSKMATGEEQLSDSGPGSKGKG